MSDGDVFFKELQAEFLSESFFLLETYEESMLGLESGANPVEDLSNIFRVAHSIKGGAAAVGFLDLSKFGHIVEDLLALLRVTPSLVNSEIISLLLASGDEFKKRISQLQKGETTDWDTTALSNRLKEFVDILNGEMSPVPVHVDKKAQPMPLDIAVQPAVVETTVEVPDAEEDHTNYELLKELEAEMAAVAPPPVPPVAVEEKLQSFTQPRPVLPKENSLVKAAKPALSFSIKVDSTRVDSVLDSVGELVVLKNQLLHDEYIKSEQNLRINSIIDQLDKSVRDLYDKTLSIRMTPLKSLFIKIQRIVRDVSLELNKPVDLELRGENTEVERTVFEILGDPLVHLVRNAMDHGVEKAEARKAAGKPAIAKVVVGAKQSGGNIVIEISDDGGGINRERVLKKAIEKKFVTEEQAKSLPDEEVFKFIFYPGFSTAEKVTDLSGRGVGLDVVKTNLEKINGRLDIKSKMGEGSNFRLTIPLSTAITDGIIVAINGAKYILPIHSVKEIICALPEDYTNMLGKGKVVKVREELIPVVNVEDSLAKINWFELEKYKYSISTENSIRELRQETMLVTLESSNGVLALPVDEVIDQAQVVVKPLNMSNLTAEVAGAAILGDGRTVLILDPNAIGNYRYQMETTSAPQKEVA